MPRTVYLEHLGQTAQLTRYIGGGKEGEVFLTTVQGTAVKILTKPSAQKIAKIKQMLHRPLPQDRFSWPFGLVLDQPGGRVIGYSMTAFCAVSLFELCHQTRADARRLGADRVTRIALAEDVADLFCITHPQKVVMADANSKGFLALQDDTGQILRPPRVVAIDCDGFQFWGRDPSTGMPKVFPCGLGQEPFLAPELVGVDLSEVIRTESQDIFALATLIWMLVKGHYPFAVCDPSGRHLSDMNALIRDGQFPFAPVKPLPPGLKPMDVGVPWRSLPSDLRSLFIRVFRDGHKDPAARPTAEELRDTLRSWLAAERKKIPSPWRAGWKYFRGHASRQDLARAFEWAAERANFGKAWAWATAGRRPLWVLGSVSVAGLMWWGLTRPPDPVAAEESRARIKEAERRWEGSPPSWREPLLERLEERHREAILGKADR